MARKEQQAVIEQGGLYEAAKKNTAENNGKGSHRRNKTEGYPRQMTKARHTLRASAGYQEEEEQHPLLSSLPSSAQAKNQRQGPARSSYELR